jgi:hypothetical protein
MQSVPTKTAFSYYRELASQNRVSLILNRTDLASLLAAWQDNEIMETEQWAELRYVTRPYGTILMLESAVA